MEYYSAINNNNIMNFAGKWMELEKIIPKWGNQVRETNMHELTYNWILAIKCRITMLQCTDPQNLDNKVPREDVWFSLRKKNEIVIRGGWKWELGRRGLRRGMGMSIRCVGNGGQRRLGERMEIGVGSISGFSGRAVIREAMGSLRWDSYQQGI